MRVHVESVLPCPPEKAWEELQRPALHREVIRPLFRFVPADPRSSRSAGWKGPPCTSKAICSGSSRLERIPSSWSGSIRPRGKSNRGRASGWFAAGTIWSASFSLSSVFPRSVDTGSALRRRATRQDAKNAKRKRFHLTPRRRGIEVRGQNSPRRRSCP